MLKEMKKQEAVSVSDLVTMLNRGELNFSPSYQRDANIWSSAKKKLFLFTLLNHNKYVIPGIFVNARPAATQFAAEVMDVVDGKQRLTTIIEFVTGKTLVGDTWTDVHPRSQLKIGNANHYYERLMADNPHMEPLFDKPFAKLPEDVQRFVMDAKIDFVKFYEYQNKTVVNIFTLLQGGVALTQGEQLKVLGSPLNEAANLIEADFGSTLSRISSAKRSSQNQTILQLLSLAVDRNAFMSITEMRKLISRTKDMKKVSAAVLRVRDFLAYIADVVALYPKGERLNQRYGRTKMIAYFAAWLEADSFPLEPEEFKASMDPIINSPEYRATLLYKSTKNGRSKQSKFLVDRMNKLVLEVEKPQKAVKAKK